jgi:hypothetical protein
VPAAQKGMEKAAPSKLPAAMAEAVHTPIPMFLQMRGFYRQIIGILRFPEAEMSLYAPPTSVFPVVRHSRIHPYELAAR